MARQIKQNRKERAKKQTFRNCKRTNKSVILVHNIYRPIHFWIFKQQSDLNV